VDFTFSAEQDDLRASVRAVLDGQRADGLSGELDDEQFARQWSAWADLGWPGLLVPVRFGGLGLDLLDACVVLEEMGRLPAPGAFLSSAVCATLAAAHLGLEDVLPGLAAGTERGAVALEELGHGDPVDRVRARATRSGAGWAIEGLKPIVLDGAEADWTLVAARTQEGLRTFIIDGPAGSGVPTLDPTRRAARLHMVKTEARSVGPDGDQTAIWRRIADDVAVALAAELVGVCDSALQMAIAHAKERVQFDVPIASHQVIQHKIVDMLHQLELGRVGVHFAAWASDVDDDLRSRSAAIAKATMGEAAVALTAENIQIHGATGFTWDCDAQRLYKRAKQNDLLLGQSGWHRQRISAAALAV
jgi:alkylation response protein AidB-like acyl-CoA dehydrogenase